MRGQGRELAATLKLQSWQVKNHLTWARRFRWQSSSQRSRVRSMWSSRSRVRPILRRRFALDYEHLEKIVMIPAHLTNSFYPFEGSVL